MKRLMENREPSPVQSRFSLFLCTDSFHANRLRKKLGYNKEFEIATIRNVGYKAVIKRNVKSNKLHHI